MNPPQQLAKCQLASEASSAILAHLSPSMLKTIETDEWRLGTPRSMQAIGNSGT
jgi:hypothetical protein